MASTNIENLKVTDAGSESPKGATHAFNEVHESQIANSKAKVNTGSPEATLPKELRFDSPEHAIFPSTSNNPSLNDSNVRSLGRTGLQGSTTFEPIDSNEKKDPSQPTVMVVDHFHQTGGTLDINKSINVDHGRLIAEANRQNGFNVLSVEAREQPNAAGSADYSKQLNEINKEIDSGDIKLGKGDSINLSIGPEQDKSFPEINNMLRTKGGMPDINVTPENLSANKERILDGMKAVQANPNSSAGEKAEAQRIVDTNEAIDKLKSKGISVLHAAPDNKDTFSPDFLHATEFTSKRPDGSLEDFSAPLSTGEKATGTLPFVASSYRNLAGSGDLPSYRIAGTDISLPADPAKGTVSNTQMFDRNADSDKKMSPISPLVGTSGFDGLPDTMKKALERTGQPFPSTGAAMGNSFGNIEYLREHRAQLQAEKLKDAKPDTGAPSGDGAQ